MNPIISAAIGIIFYGVFNVLLDYKLKNYTTPFLIAAMSVVSLVLAFIWLFYMIEMNGQNIITPKAWRVLIAAMSGVVLILLALFWLFPLKMNGGNIVLPTTWQVWVLIVICGITLFLGDGFYLNAYKSGRDIFSITTVAIMLPASIAIFKGVTTQTWPNPWQACGYVTAVITVYLLAKGSNPTV